LSGQTAAKLHHYQFRTPRQVEEAFGAEVDFDQVVKLYGQYRQHDADAKYPPSPIVEVEVRTGDPDPERICTSHIERQNLTLRDADADIYAPNERFLEEADEPEGRRRFALRTL